MCGIIAIKGDSPVSGVLSGLKKLEYRGYDSCGIACKEKDKISIYKAVGYVDNLYKTNVINEKCDIAIGHTRWATHGEVSEVNSHPHLSAKGLFAIVHNGIIENYAELKNRYLKGVRFVSETDSEVIAQLIEHFYDGDVWKAFKTAICKLKGSFAIVMINSIDNNIYFARLHSPMVIGRKGNYYSIASDRNGLEGVDEIAYLNDETIGYIDNNINLYDKKFKKIKIDFCENSVAEGRVGKGEYSHFMLKEIFEIPRVLKDTYNSITSAKFNLPKDINSILMVSCGTSYHSSLIGKKYIESLANIPVECEIASEYIYNKHINIPNTLGVFISQSGETADTLSALKRAKTEKIFTLAITNVENSSITKLADAVLYLNAGAEICVASTKAYTSQVFSLLLLTNILINNKNDRYVKNEFDNNLNSIDPNKTIDYLGLSENDYNKLYSIDISKLECEVNKIAKDIWTNQGMHLIGKDYDYITAMEGSLKIKEVSYIFTDAYPCGELKHGTLSLIDDNSIVIAITTNLQIWDKVRNSINEIISRGGKVIGITQFNMEYNGFYSKILIPELSYLLMPIVSIIPIDLLAYKISILRGINPDKPRNLAKSVTVE